MKIKITKNLFDLRPYERPKVGKTYEVKKVKEASFNPNQNRGYVIKVGIAEIIVFSDECEVIDYETNYV